MIQKNPVISFEAYDRCSAGHVSVAVTIELWPQESSGLPTDEEGSLRHRIQMISLGIS